MPSRSDMSVRPIVRFLGVAKSFPGVAALRGVSFEVKPGSCHALMGENGAGKSTLGKLLAGIYRPDAGHIELDGIARSFRRPIDAQRAGIGIVHQELSYCPNLTVAENISLSRLPRRGLVLDRGTVTARARTSLDEVGLRIDPVAELGCLSTGQIQMVQIAAALSTGARVLVMDEPTSSLSLAEGQHLTDLISRLRDRGTTILYVSHRIEEVFRICDTATVLRDGQHVATIPLAQTDENELVRMMIGRPLTVYFPSHAARPPGEARLRVESFSSPGKFRDVSFTLHAGEILGVAGLVGSGRSEVALGVYGLDPRASGRVFVDGRPVLIRNPRQAMRLGIGLVSEDRKRQGIVPEMSCAENMTLAALDCLRVGNVLRIKRERRLVLDFFQRLRVRASSPDAPITTLSGGNQQKVMLARSLLRGCKTLILDEPTRGVDVGAKAEIHRLMGDLAASGRAILMISSDMPEVLHLSTRVLVMREGRVAGVLDRAEATAERVMQLMAGRERDEAVREPSVLLTPG